MRHSTYSFLDLAGAINNPGYAGGPYIFTGEGVGSVTVAMTTDRTQHDVAADGSIMISKIEGNNGTISVECQQTSLVHKYLLGLHNYLISKSGLEWAATSMVLRNVVDGSSHICTGVSFGKVPDKPYSAAGARVSWQLYAADIVSMNL